MRTSLLVAFLSLIPAGCAMAQQAACPAPRPMRFEVTGDVRRSDLAFTQGLEFHNGMLLEGSGNVFGTSRVQRIDLRTGRVTTLQDGGQAYFGEGITVFGNRIYQLTYREGRVFQRDLQGKALREFANPREGWGLTHDAARLIASDGSDRLFFHRPADFATLGSVPVREGNLPVWRLNELEYVDGAVYANVFESWRVLKISPRTGCVLAAADLSGLRARMPVQEQARIASERDFVLNGIAYDPASRLFTVTGKYWGYLFTGRFVE
ncbi:MAG TPA: glutaminyl-peptide cyclotransferase [Rhizomicrobium sp.]|nr:glutaminyl-peptide cyclotransferase [Rhizomicrobium sp.]